MSNATVLLRTMLERAHTITRMASLERARSDDPYVSPALKEARYLALDVQQLDLTLRAGCPLPEPWQPRRPAGGTT